MKHLVWKVLAVALLVCAGACKSVSPGECSEMCLVEGAARAHIYGIYTNLYAKGCEVDLTYEDYKIAEINRANMDGLNFRRYVFKAQKPVECASAEELDFAVLVDDDRSMCILGADDW